MKKIDVDQARAWRSQGATFQQIAEVYGCARQAVQQSLARKRGGKKGAPRTIDYGEVVALRGDGWRHKDIALRLGCSVATSQRAYSLELQDESKI